MDKTSSVLTIFNQYKSAKKIIEKGVTMVQLTPHPKSPWVVFVDLGELDQLTLPKFRRLAADAVRKCQHQSNIQWLATPAITDCESHLAQVIQMVEYEVPNQKSSSKKQSKPTHYIVSPKKLVSQMRIRGC